MSTVTNAPAGPRPGTEGGIRRLRGAPRRRSLPHLLLGLLLVTSCTAGAVVWSLNVGDRRPALALARSVAVGHTFEAADLREVSVAMDGDVDAIPASEARRWSGRPRARACQPVRCCHAAFSGRHRYRRMAARSPRSRCSRAKHRRTSMLARACWWCCPRTPTPRPMTASRCRCGGARSSRSAARRMTTLSCRSSWPRADARLVAAAPVGRLSVVLVSGGDR